MKNEHILIVEDDQDGQEVIARMLNFHKIPFHVVFTGEDAIEALEHGEYSGAIFDLALPGIDGWTPRIKRHGRRATEYRDTTRAPGRAQRSEKARCQYCISQIIKSQDRDIGGRIQTRTFRVDLLHVCVKPIC